MIQKELDINEIVNIASAYYGSAVLFSAIENNVFTHISEIGESASVENIASVAGVQVRGLRLLLDACVAIGVLKKNNGIYSNTQAGKLALVSGAPADLSKAILYNRDVYASWGKLSEFVNTAKPVENPQEHLGDDPERTKRFVFSMHGRAMAIGQTIIPMFDLTGCRKLLDLAGGPGTYSALMAKAYPELSCVTVDLPAVSEEAKQIVASMGMSERVECRSGDYHTDEYESGVYDVVTIFGALHQESPESIVDILKRANSALKSGGKLFVLDMMTDETHTQPAFSALFAVNMALTTDSGWVFSDCELKEWMKQAGFIPGETLYAPPPMPHWLVSAHKK